MSPFHKIAALLKLAAAPRCADISRILSRRQDAPLPWMLRKRLEWHLAACELCRRYADQISLLGHFARRFSSHSCECGLKKLSTHAAERIKNKLRDAKK
jgi:hypothetical protein